MTSAIAVLPLAARSQRADRAGADSGLGDTLAARADSAQMRTFARRIVGEHRAVEKEAVVVAGQLSATPTMPEVG